MSFITRRQRWRKGNFDFAAKRRREIIAHAQYVGAADTEDFSRWLIAWVWHNTKAKDQIWSVMECARNTGRVITEAEASAITEEASIIRERRTAKGLAHFLGVTYAQRKALGLTTIGCTDVSKRGLEKLRRRKDLRAKERKRRADGVAPRAAYLANSLSATKPWEKLGMSRATYYRNKPGTLRETGSSSPIFLIGEDTPVSPEGGAGVAERGFASKKERLRPKAARPEGATLEARGCASSRTATKMAAEIHASLPLELRLLALGLPLPDELRQAA